MQAAQLSATAAGLAVSLFASCMFIGQSSAGVALGAITFTHGSPAWSFAAAAFGLLLLGLVVRRAVLSEPVAGAPADTDTPVA
jgi:hypothetical protein